MVLYHVISPFLSLFIRIFFENIYIFAVVSVVFV